MNISSLTFHGTRSPLDNRTVSRGCQEETKSMDCHSLQGEPRPGLSERIHARVERFIPVGACRSTGTVAGRPVQEAQ